MKNIVVVASSSELDIVISALSTVPQKVEKTRRGWFGGKADIRHERRIENGPIKFEAGAPKADADDQFLSQHANVLHVYDYRPHGKPVIRPHAVGMLTFLENQYSAIDWGGVGDFLRVNEMTRTGQRFRVKLPSGFSVVIEPLKRDTVRRVVGHKSDSRLMDSKQKVANNALIGASGLTPASAPRPVMAGSKIVDQYAGSGVIGDVPEIGVEGTLVSLEGAEPGDAAYLREAALSIAGTEPGDDAEPVPADARYRENDGTVEDHIQEDADALEE